MRESEKSFYSLNRRDETIVSDKKKKQLLKRVIKMKKPLDKSWSMK